MRKSTGLHHACAVYAKQVTQGKLRQSCCKWEILACQRHLDDLKRQGTDEPCRFCNLSAGHLQKPRNPAMIFSKND